MRLQTVKRLIWKQKYQRLNHEFHLSGGEKKSMSKEEKIAALEEELKSINAKSMTTTAGGYGTKPKSISNMEMFSMTHNNIQKDPDLMPCPRRPPKKWSLACISPNLYTFSRNSLKST